ncbi:hypothetical protein QEJ31_08350 [Pigmentibacter sp. JX0631]|uniref:hypothetical protein n=1 Tax=Pigmentibacter sp. JX0631 TaxID=2976982 RepID=UPI0024686FEC|nr:hypothetical protein [Pigmentibacter sp. JX0631]WGL58548.1 hypothetical protein QEJ31_08350 [Pigmentibacter sp. JX0631]
MLKKIVNKITLISIAFASITACTTTSKSEQNTAVYFRSDIAIKTDKIILFPTMYLTRHNFIQENKNFKGTLIDAKIAASWASNLNKAKLIPIPRQILNEIPAAWESLDILTSMMDNSEEIKKNENNSVVEKFVHNITKKYGKNSVLAFSVVFEDESEYISTNTVHKNIGLYDTNSMSWKWITKDVFNSNFVPVPYEVAVGKIISNSFDAVKKQNKDKLF